MINPLTEIKDYWTTTSDLNAALPITSVYFGMVPPSKLYPFASLVDISRVPDHTTGSCMIEEYHFQLSIYHTSLDALTLIADAIDQQLDESKPFTQALRCERTNRIQLADALQGNTVFTIVLSYLLRYNATLGA